MYYFLRAVIIKYYKLGGLKSPQIYSFTVLGSRSPKSKCHQAFREDSRGRSFFVSPWLMVIANNHVSWLLGATSKLCLNCHTVLFLCLSAQIFLFLQRHQSLDYIHLNRAWPHFNLITSSKTLFPNKFTFIDTRG